VALPGRPGAPPAANRSERGVKVLERPRREDVDTAAWQPDLVTGAEGRVRFSFRMPDSLTRWRITARAANDDGLVGQRRGFVRSEKPLYLKWSGPTRYREGDRPAFGLLAFNQGDTAAEAELATSFAGETARRAVTLPPGASWLPLPGLAFRAGELQVQLVQAGAAVDALAVTLRAAGDEWQVRQSTVTDVAQADVPLSLPADARNLELQLAGGTDALFRGALDDLLAYPWGCVEQTASRLLPLALAYPQLAQGEARIADRLRLVMQTSRLRLVQMAGPNARFTWWGEGADEDVFLTGYAYYADWHASRSLGIELPPEHWQRVLELYAEKAAQTPLLQRVLVLDFAQHMQLPVQTLLQGVVTELAAAGEGSDERELQSPQASVVLEAPDSALGLALARVLAANLARDVDVALPEGFALDAARAKLEASPLPFAQAALLQRAPVDAAKARELFARLAPEDATLERALVLAWLHEADAAAPVAAVSPGAGWQPVTQPSGEVRWRWQGETPPGVLALASAPPVPLTARLSYESAAPAQSTLPLRIERRLYELVPGSDPFAFTAEPHTDGPLSSDRLYLDEIVLHAPDDTPLRYGLVEVPLPPGADVERTTWGLQISGLGGEGTEELEKARHEEGDLGYALPLDTLAGEARFRHLVRFSQKGAFVLPPVRYVRMYAPEDQALEADPPLSHLSVE
jgi:uncharacterized protein YfaS (alpha-2-macroglobulin family)